MKVTLDNYKDLIPKDNQLLMHALLEDLNELNTELENLQEPYRKLYIDYITEHTEYSTERTDPCPDYYGMYRLRFEKNPYETVGLEMTIKELDNVLCVLINFTEFKLS
jgi:nitrate reductase assembly molybdenum cofactor insertion protein NarJ